MSGGVSGVQAGVINDSDKENLEWTWTVTHLDKIQDYIKVCLCWLLTQAKMYSMLWICVFW